MSETIDAIMVGSRAFQIVAVLELHADDVDQPIAELSNENCDARA